MNQLLWFRTVNERKCNWFNAWAELLQNVFLVVSEAIVNWDILQGIFLGVNSKNSDVLNYIRKNLNYKKIENPGKRDKIYTMPLKLASK